MLKNIQPAHYETITEYDIVFDDGHRNGFAFPCDKNGKILKTIPEEAKKNYLRCLQWKDKFVRYNAKVETEYIIRVPARGTCRCGNIMDLIDTYHGACMCEKCNTWYNLFGQELLPPNEWEESEEY